MSDYENVSKRAGGIYAIRYRENGTIYRDLVKTFGFRFSIFVHGRAGRFSIIPLLLNLGSGLALLSIDEGFVFEGIQ
ncbi:hypothetical protein ACTXT7_003448 [Hymenolepis weldensis]